LFLHGRDVPWANQQFNTFGKEGGWGRDAPGEAPKQ